LIRSQLCLFVLPFLCKLSCTPILHINCTVLSPGRLVYSILRRHFVSYFTDLSISVHVLRVPSPCNMNITVPTYQGWSIFLLSERKASQSRDFLSRPCGSLALGSRSPFLHFAYCIELIRVDSRLTFLGLVPVLDSQALEDLGPG